MEERCVQYGDHVELSDRIASIRGEKDAIHKLSNSMGGSLLTVAIEHNQWKAFDTLVNAHLKLGIPLSIGDREGLTSLHFAARHNFREGVRRLIDGGAFVNPKDDRGKTPLHVAIQYYRWEIVQMLVLAGASIHIKDKQGKSPVSMVEHLKGEFENKQPQSKLGAMTYDNLVNMVRSGRCVQLEATTKIVNGSNKPALKNSNRNIFRAITRGDMHLLKTLIEKEGKDTMINTCSNKGFSPIYLACQYGYGQILEYLISKGAQPTIQNTVGTTPLHVAIENHHIHIIEILLKFRVNVLAKNYKGKQGLDLAIEKRDTEIIGILLPYHISATENFYKDSLDPRISWMFRKAIVEGDDNLAFLLIDSGSVDFNLQTQNGWTPLHVAAKFNREEVMYRMINRWRDIDPERQVNPNLTTGDGWTALHICCSLKSEKSPVNVVRHLLTAGADQNLANLNGVVPLHLAVQSGHVDVVQLLVDFGANIHVEDSRKATPLSIAFNEKKAGIVGILAGKGASNFSPESFFELCRRGDSDLIIALLQGESIDPNFAKSTSSGKSWPCLNMAVLKEASPAAISLMIEKGADIERQVGGYGPLHTACSIRNVELVKILCDNGANPNVPNPKGYFPIHTAIIMNQMEIVEILLSHGSQAVPFPNLKPERREFGSLLQIAFISRNFKLAAALFQHVAEFHPNCNLKLFPKKSSGKSFRKSVETETIKSCLFWALKFRNADLLESVLKFGGDPNVPNERGSSALHYVIHKITRPEKFVEILLQHGADFNLKNENGRTALHLALDTKNVKLCKILLSQAEIDVNVKEVNGFGPIHLLMNWMNPEHRQEVEPLLKTLLEKGADINDVTTAGWTPFHIAVNKEDITLMETLVQLGANLNLKTNLDTPINMAMSRDRVDSLTWLLSKNVKLNVSNFKDSWTTLHTAAKMGKVDLLDQLFKFEMEPDIRDFNGWSPLHVAVLAQDVDVIVYLLERGASLTCDTDIGWTPLHTAAKMESPTSISILKLLLEQPGVDPNPRDQGGLTPLDLAIDAGFVDKSVYLMNKGGISPKFSLLSGFASTKSGWTPLHSLISESKISFIPEIIAGCDVNSQESGRMWSPLHAAARHGDADTVKLLLSHGADPMLTDKHGRTAFDVATTFHNRAAAKLILKSGGQDLLYNRDNNDKCMVEHMRGGRFKKSIMNIAENKYRQDKKEANRDKSQWKQENVKKNLSTFRRKETREEMRMEYDIKNRGFKLPMRDFNREILYPWRKERSSAFKVKKVKPMKQMRRPPFRGPAWKPSGDFALPTMYDFL